MASFLNGLNRVFRINNIISHDDADITSFSDTQHNADINRGIIAIQDELSEIVSERDIPYERTSTTITLATGTRTYSLASDFVRFYGTANFYDSTDNVKIFEAKGGEKSLELIDYQYLTTQGTPMMWYWSNTTSKEVAFYNVPDSNYNNRSLTYLYEASVMVSNASDTLPFHNNEEYFSFTQMAARRMIYMKEGNDLGALKSDEIYREAKARLYQFIRASNPSNSYGYLYR